MSCLKIRDFIVKNAMVNYYSEVEVDLQYCCNLFAVLP